ncbi:MULTISPECIES: hypothetical protein [Yersinia]|uniref:hypothetical protein n=1 Tax=Yersinia TaxID=629 RepID=UPI0005380E08|nr:hypothetical protein [Yersinia ruckeri]AUQ43817.1 hypothetical protein NJ56_17750 [Yersinia ruckeri]UIN19273.1 hypothetical protein LGL86_17470 [Yersinia ruckeri]HDL7588266.1 hypothetical protein [Yersinia enterocolitica]HDL7813455.1 hypothetical protein [Yersinia enterocolitica]
MDYHGRLYKYPHLPIQVFWFDRDEWLLLIASYIGSMQIGGISFFIFFTATTIAISIKRSHGRGYFRHILYKFGLVEYKLYPDSTAENFDE